MIKVLKFGGSSLASPERIQSVGEIILKEIENQPVIVVVSAFHSVTNQLLQCAKLAENHDDSYIRIFDAIAKKHIETMQNLVTTPNARILTLLEELKKHLEGVHLVHECSLRSLDLIASFGERLSAEIITFYLNTKIPTSFADARDFIVTDDRYTEARVLFSETNKAIKKFFKNNEQLVIATGFIGASEKGETTTIGRDGSDYSAAIIGAALNASQIEIWTDVDGIYTADPRIVERAYVIPHVSYEEAMELSHFGAKVLHSAAIAPAIREQIPILIKNSFQPEAPGTLISNEVLSQADKGVKGISSINDVTLLTLRGLNMVGVPGTAERLFRGLAKKDINIILISQASSEHTICFAIKESDVANAETAIHEEFHREIEYQLLKIEKKSSQTIIAVVGDNMRGVPAVAGKFCYALGQNKVNINAIAQGGSERNISLAINTNQSPLALNAVHQFFFETHKRLSLCLIGVGNVGSALITILEQQFSALYEKGYEVSICLIANSKHFIFDAKGIDLKNWQAKLHQSTDTYNVNTILNLLASTQLTHLALVDCTASSEIVQQYLHFIEKNIHIVTPNKKANVLPWHDYQILMKQLEKYQCHFLFEANVGAGLPIISTLQDLLMGGDSIIKIEGIFSGTLSYLFNEYDGTMKFSEIVQEAHSKGYTEPDPRDDLSGQDVARKLLILARLLGRKMDFEDIQIENLVPKELQSGNFENQFFKSFEKMDDAIKRKLEKAQKNNCVLRYVGVLDEKGAHAELQEVPLTHPLARTKQSDNIIAFTTQRYALSPLVVQGPGAGATVTAMGVFSDIVKLLHYLPY